MGFQARYVILCILDHGMNAFSKISVLICNIEEVESIESGCCIADSGIRQSVSIAIL